MHRREIDAERDLDATARYDRAAAVLCFTVACVVVIGVLARTLELFARGCNDQHHGCATFIFAVPAGVVIGVVFAGLGYWLLPGDRGSQ